MRNLYLVATYVQCHMTRMSRNRVCLTANFTVVCN